MALPRFRDRDGAADALIALLPAEIGADWLVLGLARGGVPIARRIAQHLGAVWAPLVVRKVGLPGNPEIALAAVTGAGKDELLVNEPLADASGVDPARIERLAAPEIAEVERRKHLWFPQGKAPDPSGRKVLVVDDGVATATTMAAAIRHLGRQGAARICIAVPVALGDSLGRLAQGQMPIICPFPNETYEAIGMAYASFPQVTDSSVGMLLSQARAAAVPIS